MLFEKNTKDSSQLSSTSHEAYPIISEDRPIGSIYLKDKSSSNINNNYKKIIIDLQKEFDEDQELLELLQPQRNQNQNEQKKTGIKALFELKQSKIDMIPEEDEEKLKQETKILNYKNKDRNIRQYNNGSAITNRCLNHKTNQDNSNYNNIAYNNNKRTNQQQQQLSTITDNNLKLNLENERKEKGGLVSPLSRIDCNGCLITNEKNNESPSTSSITHDSIKRHSNIYLYLILI